MPDRKNFLSMECAHVSYSSQAGAGSKSVPRTAALRKVVAAIEDFALQVVESGK
jgi:hypothetical protein